MVEESRHFCLSPQHPLPALAFLPSKGSTFSSDDPRGAFRDRDRGGGGVQMFARPPPGPSHIPFADLARSLAHVLPQYDT